MNMLHRYTDYRWLRGFNIIPSWGVRIEQAWWDYEPARFREEAALATLNLGAFRSHSCHFTC